MKAACGIPAAAARPPLHDHHRIVPVPASEAVGPEVVAVGGEDGSGGKGLGGGDHGPSVEQCRDCDDDDNDDDDHHHHHNYDHHPFLGTALPHPPSLAILSF